MRSASSFVEFIQTPLPYDIKFTTSRLRVGETGHATGPIGKTKMLF